MLVYNEYNAFNSTSIQVICGVDSLLLCLMVQWGYF